MCTYCMYYGMLAVPSACPDEREERRKEGCLPVVHLGGGRKRREICAEIDRGRGGRVRISKEAHPPPSPSPLLSSPPPPSPFSSSPVVARHDNSKVKPTSGREGRKRKGETRTTWLCVEHYLLLHQCHFHEGGAEAKGEREQRKREEKARRKRRRHGRSRRREGGKSESMKTAAVFMALKKKRKKEKKELWDGGGRKGGRERSRR